MSALGRGGEWRAEWESRRLLCPQSPCPPPARAALCLTQSLFIAWGGGKECLCESGGSDFRGQRGPVRGPELSLQSTPALCFQAELLPVSEPSWENCAGGGGRENAGRYMVGGRSVSHTHQHAAGESSGSILAPAGAHLLRLFCSDQEGLGGINTAPPTA